MGTTTLNALPYPEPTDAVAAGADAIKALAQAIDPKLAIRGLAAARPAAPVAGTVHFATDTKRLSVYDGTGWVIMYEPRQSWVPDWQGITEAGSTNVGNYTRCAGWVDVNARIIIQAGAALPGQPGIILPIAAVDVVDKYEMSCNLVQASGGSSFPGIVAGGSGTGALFYVMNTTGTYAGLAVTSASVPFTWVIGSYIDFKGRYQMSSPYS